MRKAAARRIQESATLEAARKYGTPRRTTPVDALDEELHRTQGHVDWLDQQIANNGADPGWLSVYQSERAHLARLSNQMIIARTDERRIVLAEQTVTALETALNGILAELGHDPNTTYIRGVVERHLMAASQQDGTVEAEVVTPDPSNVQPIPTTF